MKVNPYLTFDGNAEEAMRFYAQVLGGSLGPINRFSEMPGETSFSEDMKQRVMHVTLAQPDGESIMASDTFPGMGGPFALGNNFSISLHPTQVQAAEQLFAELSEGGQVTTPLVKQFWGAHFGSLVDRFGVQWMINCVPA